MAQLSLLESVVPESVPRYALAVERPVVYLGVLGAVDRLPMTMLSAQFIVAHQLETLALYAAACYDDGYKAVHGWWLPENLMDPDDCPAGLIAVIEKTGILDGSITFKTVANFSDQPIVIPPRTNVFELNDLERSQLNQKTTVEHLNLSHAADTSPPDSVRAADN